MDPVVTHGWTSYEVEEASSLIARLNTNKIIYDDNDEKNRKHNYIVNSLHALFPSKTMKQVIDLYVNLAMEMHTMHWREGGHVTGGNPQNSFTFSDPTNDNYLLPGEENGASSTHNVYTMGDHADENFGVREATIMYNNELSFGCAMEDTRNTVMGEALLMVDNNKKEALENNISTDQSAVAPQQWEFSNIEEHSMGDLVNENFEVQEDEDTTMDDNGFSFRYALGDTRITKTEEALMMVDKNRMVVLENSTSNDRPVVAPHQRKYWTKGEHKSFLHGLQIYGRSDWKNISKHFVTTKTPVQVSSHAQKFFKRIEKKASSGTKRYSINDITLHDDDMLAANNSSVPQQVLSFTGLNNDPGFRLQAPTSSFAVMNNKNQLCSPSIYNQQVGQQPMWSEQQMMGSIAAVMSFVPDRQQGSAYFYRGNV